MNKYGGFLQSAAYEYQIIRGKTEDEQQWKIRIIYSILGRMALASLFDIAEGEASSVIHMKHRVEILTAHYKEMFPELSMLMPADAETLSNEIYDIYLKTGTIYHKAHHAVMASKSEALANGIRFTRGLEIESKQKISGLGTYIREDFPKARGLLAEMFQLEPLTLDDRWNQCIKHAKWKESQLENSEFLRMAPPFKRGYWVNKPDASGKVSLLRIGFKGSRLYYLYKVENRKVLVSQLPQWQAEDYTYRSLANACLHWEGVLPPSTYRYDGELVYFSFGYLPPPAELYLWKLYSWPTSITSLPSDFKRSCSRLIFETIKPVMQQQGYEFIEE